MSVLDVVVYTIALIGIMMVSVYTGYVILDAVEDKGIINVRFINDGKDAMRTFNGMVIFIIICIFIASLVYATQIEAHPAMALISIFVLALLVSVAAWVANIYYEIATEPVFAAAGGAADEMPAFVTLIDNLPLLVALLGILLLIATYAKPWRWPRGQLE